MHKIKFKGKRKDNGEWVYGYYVAFSIPQDYPRFKVEHRIYTHLDEADCSISFEVIPETVGQFVCLDKHEEEVYVGDKVRYHDTCSDDYILDGEKAEKTIGQINWIEHRHQFMPQEIRKNHKGGHYIAHWDFITNIELIKD